MPASRRFLSLCSGIEAASVAWEPLGWRAAALAEIAPFPSAVLAHRWPQVPNLGDFTAISAETLHALGPVSACIAGTPCQPFSIAGLRQGLDDPRGNLALAFLRVVGLTRPRWVVWENVPGVLSSNGGRDFGTFLAALGKLGYGFAYRVLDAQYFGVAQRRRRVFVVGCLGDWRGAAAVLFERDCLSGYPAPCRQAGTQVAGTLEARAGGGGFDAGAHGAATGHLVAAGLAPTLAASGAGTARTGNARTESDFLIAHTLRAGGFDASEDGTGRGTPLVVPQSFAWQQGGTQGMALGDDIGITLIKNQHPAVRLNGAVRRITPREAEALQGFPVDYTLVPGEWRGRKPQDRAETLRYYITDQLAHGATLDEAIEYAEWLVDCPDGPRYHALGNSMAVPVIQWIGERIDLVDSLSTSQAYA